MSDVSIIIRKMRTHAERNQSCLGIGFPEQVALMHLAAHGASNQDSIAATLEIDKGAIAKTVAKLEEKNLVTREVNPKNKREKLVALTPAALEILENMQISYMELEQKMFAGLTPEQIASMKESLAHVAQNLSRD